MKEGNASVSADKASENPFKRFALIFNYRLQAHCQRRLFTRRTGRAYGIRAATQHRPRLRRECQMARRLCPSLRAWRTLAAMRRSAPTCRVSAS